MDRGEPPVWRRDTIFVESGPGPARPFGAVRTLALLSLLVSGCAAHRFECVQHGGRPAIRIESDHFAATSDLPAEELTLELRRLERLWDAYSVFFQYEPTTTGRVPVLVSRDEAADEFIAGSGGFFVASIEPIFVTTVQDFDVSGKTVRRSASAHELVHLVSRFWLPRQSRWIAEGLAEYLGDADFKREEVVRFGRWQWSDRYALHPLPDLWDWDIGAPVIRADLYESAWAWIHYLANRDEARLARLWQALRTQPSARAAFDSVFPPGEQAALYEKVEAYLVEGRYQGWESRLQRDPEVSPAATVPPWQVHLLRRSILQHTGLREDARREAQRAADVAPTPTPPEVALALAEDTLFGPACTDVLLRHAELPQAMVLLGLAPDLRDEDRFAWLEKATSRAPDSARAQLAFAEAANARGDPRGLAAAQQAVALAPWALAARLAEVTALAGQSRCADALAALEAAASLGDERNNVAKQVARVKAELATKCPEAR